MSEWLYGVIMPVLFFTFTGLMFGESANTASIDTTTDTIFCDFPDYNLGGNATGNGCLNTASYAPTDDCLTHSFVIWNATGAWYSGGSEWVACIPTGWADYTADVLTLAFQKVGALIYYLPALLFTYTTPSEFVTYLPFWGVVESVLMGIFFISSYKLISPMVS